LLIVGRPESSESVVNPFRGAFDMVLRYERFVNADPWVGNTVEMAFCPGDEFSDSRVVLRIVGTESKDLVGPSATRQTRGGY